MKEIDKTKKSNIKCEHCNWWLYHNLCMNENSPKYNTQTNYWNRCKCFEWRKKDNEKNNVDTGR